VEKVESRGLCGIPRAVEREETLLLVFLAFHGPAFSTAWRPPHFCFSRIKPGFLRYHYCRWSVLAAFLLLQSSAETIGFRSGLDDVGLIGQPVEHRFAEARVGEHRGPLGEG
jgi:hypothetical protein